MNALQAQSIVRLIRHLEASHVTPEATLSRDLSQLLTGAEKALGIVVRVNTSRVLDALALIAGPS